MAAAAGMWEKAYIVRMWDELDQLWTNFRDQKLDQNFKQVSSCARSLDPGPLSRLRNEGFSANTCFSRAPHVGRARPYRNDPCCEKFLRAEPEKNLSFPPALNGFSHCGIHQDFDTLLCRLLPPWLCRTAASLAAACTLLPRCTGRASAPILTSGLGLPGFKFRVKDASPRQ